MYKRIFQCALLVIGCVSLTTMAATHKQHGVKNLLASTRDDPVATPDSLLEVGVAGVDLERGKLTDKLSTGSCKSCEKKKKHCEESDSDSDDDDQTWGGRVSAPRNGCKKCKVEREPEPCPLEEDRPVEGTVSVNLGSSESYSAFDSAFTTFNFPTIDDFQRSGLNEALGGPDLSGSDNDCKSLSGRPQRSVSIQQGNVQSRPSQPRLREQQPPKGDCGCH